MMKAFLDEAMERSREAALRRELVIPADELIPSALEADGPDFAEAMARNGGPVRVIAEVKRLSPSAGDINAGASVARTAAAYEEAGAAAVSVLTSEYGFGGSIRDISEARSGCRVPLLCKDFISMPYQVVEALATGASAVLLIADALPRRTLASLVHLCDEAGGVALVEAHSREGLERALEAQARLVGINNRDLETLEVDIATTERLIGLVPEGTTVVSESGIRTRQDVLRIEALGVDAMLIGEALMRSADPGEKLRELLAMEKT